MKKFIFLLMPSLLLNISLDSEFKLGLENIPKSLLSKLSSKNVGLITNQSGIDQSGKRGLDYLLDLGVDIKAVYVPEHGLDGTYGSGDKVSNSTDKKTGIPIISLYDGDSRPKKFKKSDLDNIDVLVFDMQDSGMRHFTYVSTMYKMMQTALEFNKEFIVLDRPNPLGYVMEGPLVDDGLKSFISIESFPVRHGLTLGELALYFNKYSLKSPINLTVVPMKDYDRRNGLDGKLNAWISPGIRSIESCYGYSFLGLLGEIRPFAIGLRSGKPFQCIMLKKGQSVDFHVWDGLRRVLKKHNIAAVFHDYCLDKSCFEGLLLKFGDINEVDAFSAFIAVLLFFKNQGINLEFSKAFDISVGTKLIRKYLDGEITKSELFEKINSDLKGFANRIKPFLLYRPYPKLILFKN